MAYRWEDDLPCKDYPRAVRLLVRRLGQEAAEGIASAASDGHRIPRPDYVRAQRAKDLPSLLEGIDLTHHQGFAGGLIDEFMDAYVRTFEQCREDYNLGSDDHMYAS